MSDRYDTIGEGYAATRREDLLIARRIHAALGDARHGHVRTRDEHDVGLRLVVGRPG